MTAHEQRTFYETEYTALRNSGFDHETAEEYADESLEREIEWREEGCDN